MKGAVGVLFLALTCTILSNNVVTAQSPTNAANSVGLFTFNPQDVAKFLWSSLRPQYEDMFRDKQVLGNASAYIVQLAKSVFPTNVTDNWLNSPLGKEILNVIDSEMVQLYKGMDTQKASLEDMLQRLTKFNMNKIVEVMLKQSLLSLQNSMSVNVTESLTDVIDKLERDQSIASELQQMLDSVPMTVSMQVINATKFVKRLDEALRELTKVLKSDPNWGTYSAMYKLRTLLMKFDYQTFGSGLMESALKALDSALPNRGRVMLKSFIDKLHNTQPLNFQQIFPQEFPIMYSFVRDQLNTSFLPEISNMNFEALQFLGIFDIIEGALEQAMKVIKADTTGSFVLWSNTHNFTDVERLALVLGAVDYTSIGQSIMGNILKVIGNDSQMELFTNRLITEMFDSMNLTTGNEVLVNRTADILVETLQESLKEQERHINWTSLTSSERLGKVVMGADWMAALRQLFVAVVKQEEAILPTSVKDSVKEMYSFINSGNVVEISSRLTVQLDKAYEMMWNDSTPSDEVSDAKAAIIESITKQLVDANELIKNGADTVATAMLHNLNQTFAKLTEVEKLAYVVISVNYTIVGETIKEQMNVVLEVRAGHVLDMLERKESIVPAFEDLISSIQQLPFVTYNMTQRIDRFMNSTVMNDVLGSINSEMVEAYKKMSANSTVWGNYSSNREQLMALLKAYNYIATGDIIMTHSLAPLDSRLPANVTSFIDDFISTIQQRSSVFHLVKDLRNKMVERYPVLGFVTVDSLMPVCYFIDQHIQNMTKDEFDTWNSISGKLPKVYMFLRSVNYTRLYEETGQAWLRLVVNIMSGGLVPSIPEDSRSMMVDAMNVVESGGVADSMAEMVMKMGENNMMMKWLANSTLAQSLIQSMARSITEAYKEVKRTSDSEWRFMSSEEKLLRVLIRLDKPKMLMDAYKAANETAHPFLNPTYSTQCSNDLSTVQYAIGKGISNPTDYFWAIQLADSWGKLPAGLLQARFTWPGDMLQCEKVKGNRIQVVNATTDEVVVLEEDGIKGAWSMATIEIPKPAGLSVPSMFTGASPNIPLNWGICLPESCTYNDTFKFMKRVNVFGAKLTIVKLHSTYPVLTGEYKDDPKFIGVSFYLGLLVVLAVICTAVDKLVLTRMEEHRKKRENTYAMTNMNGELTEKKAHENGGYIHDEKSVVANGSVEDGAKTNGHLADHKPVAVVKETYKPGVGIQLIKSFSLYENLPKLMDSANKPNQLQALDGIRFLSMTWVILGHVYAFIAVGPYTQNIGVATEFGGKGDWTFMGINGGLFAVDSFFLLSGLLVGYLFLKVLDKVKGKVSCFTMTMYYVHRYIRLLPLYASIILITIAYSNYYGRGPLNRWFTDEIKNPCDVNWWTNLLYINNFFKTGTMCSGVGWYLANDMQFYVISPLLLLPLYLVPKIGMALIGALWLASVIVTGYLWGTKDGGSNFIDPTVMDEIYIKPWCRIQPYLLGLLLAYVLFKKMKIKSCLMQAMWWVVALGLLALVVYIPYDSTKENGILSSSWNSTQRTSYEVLCKNAWALALGWIIFASNTGCGGFIGDMLSWGGWAPLSRLTYAAFLIHPIVLDLNYKNRHNLIYVGHDSLIFDNIAFITITYMVSLILHLLIEAPMLGLEKIILPRK